MKYYDEKFVNGTIQFLTDKSPIYFAYKMNIDKPDNHTLHINKFYEIYIFIDGNADYIVGGSLFNLKRGDIIIINQYEVHKPVLKDVGPYERFYFLVPADTFDTFMYNPFVNLSKKLILLSDAERNKALDILYEINKTLGSADSNLANFKACGLFIQFISIIGKSLSKNNSNEILSIPNKLPKYIADILIYIDANLTEINTAEEIAKHFGITLTYLSSIFKNAIGTTIKSYIQTKKIAYAKELLDNDFNVTEACYKSGFNDCSYFIKIFKQHIGVTPLNYRKYKSDH